MNHDEWATAQAATTVTVDGHELSVAYHWVMENRTETYVEELDTFLADD